MKIGVAIPTYGKDVMFLNRCLRSIEKQTKLPIIVAISASSCKKEDIFIDKYSFPIQIISTENPQNASANRNKAGDWILEIGNVDIISFFDSDDEMYPNRLEFIEKAFLETECDIVLHNYDTIKSYNQEIPLRNNKCLLFTNCIVPHPHHCGVIVKSELCTNLSKELSTDLTHGNVSVKINVWQNEKFREESNYVLWEDSEYCRRLVLKYKSTYIQNILTKYHNYNETFNDYYYMIMNCIKHNFLEEYQILLKFVLTIATDDQKLLLAIYLNNKTQYHN